MTTRPTVLAIAIPDEREPCGGWQAARARLNANPRDEERAALSPLLNLVEGAWSHLRRLVDVYEEIGGRSVERAGALGQLLAFLVDDVVDLFRGVALDCAQLVPGLDGFDAEPDVDGTEGEADRFFRYLVVLRLAVSDESVPAALRATVRDVAEELDGWLDHFVARIRFAGDLLQGSAR